VALHWCAVTVLARELARRRTLHGDAIDLILRPFKVHGRTTVERDRVYEEDGMPLLKVDRPCHRVAGTCQSGPTSDIGRSLAAFHRI
jgi:hypothetical protein